MQIHFVIDYTVAFTSYYFLDTSMINFSLSSYNEAFRTNGKSWCWWPMYVVVTQTYDSDRREEAFVHYLL